MVATTAVLSVLYIRRKVHVLVPMWNGMWKECGMECGMEYVPSSFIRLFHDVVRSFHDIVRSFVRSFVPVFPVFPILRYCAGLFHVFVRLFDVFLGLIHVIRLLHVFIRLFHDFVRVGSLIQGSTSVVDVFKGFDSSALRLQLRTLRLRGRAFEGGCGR